MDCSLGKTNVEMIRTTYDELIDEGFTVRRIVVTHPDRDHYDGIDDVIGFPAMNSPPVLLTHQFKDKLKETLTAQYPYQFPLGKQFNEDRDTGSFNVEYTSTTSDLVLHSKTKHEGELRPAQNCTFQKTQDADRKNESSVITTITLNDRNTILACLTGDAFFDSHLTAPFLHNRKIIVFQVPHHGSKHNSNFEFYVQIAEKTQYYLISCGHHGSYGFPHKKVFTAIRDATVARKKEGATIVLTDGTLLNGEKVSSFRGGDYEPHVSYWDPHLKEIKKPFLQFTFTPTEHEICTENLIQWSITGYKRMAGSNPKQRLRIHLKASNNRHLQVVNGALTTQRCDGNGCTTSIDGYLGLPAPTDPCAWDNKVIMVDGTDDLIFLQLTTGEKIIQEHKYEDVQTELEKSISKVSRNKLSVRNAKEYEKIISLLSKAITTIIFRTISTPAEKNELIEEVKKALEIKTDPYYIQTFHEITENERDVMRLHHLENERDVVMTLLRLEHKIRQSLLTNSEEKHTQEMQDFEKKNQKLLEQPPAPQNIITSFDGKQRISFFKCYKVPWQIVYGTISDNGEVNWPDHHVHNSLQVYTPTTPLNFKLI